MIKLIYQKLLFVHMFKLKLWLMWSLYMMGENEVWSVMLRAWTYGSTFLAFLFHKSGGWVVIHSSSAVKVAPKEAGMPVWGPPSSCLKYRLRNTPLLKGHPVLMFSWAPSWRPAHISFTRCLYWWAYVTPESLTHLKQCISQCSCGKSGRMPLERGASTIGSDSY